MTTSSLPEIHFSGLASGIDTDSLIEKLMTLERRPQTMLKMKNEDYAAKKAVISTLNSKLSTLSTTIDKFSNASSPFFTQKTTASTLTTVVQAVITGAQPAEGNYQITVTQVATAAMTQSQAALYTGADRVAQGAKMQSATGINAPSQTVDPAQSLATQAANLGTVAQASGTLVINGSNINWDDTMSINQILGNINNAGLGVTASFDTGTQEISLTSNITGATSEIILSESSGNLLGVMNITAGTATGNDAVQTNSSVALNSSGANMDQTVTSGTFTLNGVVFNVDAAADTLDTVINRINTSSAGVTANFNQETGTVGFIQKTEGSSQKITLGAAGDTSNILYALKLSSTNPPVGGAADTYSGTDAQVSLNGGAAQTFESNEIATLIPGVTLNLKGAGSSLVTVSSNVDGMVQTFKDFVNQYNDVMNYINTKIREERVESPTTSEERIQGQFTGDMTFLDTKYKLSSMVSQVISGMPNTMNQMAQIGITTTADNLGKDATLALDETKLRAALSSNVSGVEDMFNTVGTGITGKMKDQLYSLTNFIDGEVTVEKKFYDSEISSTNTQILEMEERLVKREETMRLQFASMETLISQLKSQGDRITQLMGQST
jgi:flagellar hook-associated protein 2